MTYEKVLEKIKGLSKFGIKPGFSRINKILACLSNPQDKLKFIHVAGTNGKGSVCFMLASILSEAGYKVGLFTSPFVTDFCETMQINGRKISKEDIIKLYEIIAPFTKNSKDCATEFEVVTSIAFKWFEDQACDIIILETGLGGRLDCTNVIKDSLVSVICSISYDHTDILGSSLVEIAKEKCGIIKSGRSTILYPDQESSVFDVIENKCKEKKSRVLMPNRSKFVIVKKDINGTDLIFEGMSYKLPLVGEHQVNNLSVVFEVLDEIKKYGFITSNKDRFIGLRSVNVPARFEIIKRNPPIILDGAHNFDAICSLMNTIKIYFGGKNFFAIFSMLENKDYVSCIEKITPLIDVFVVTNINSSRACDPKILADQIKKYKKIVYIEDNVKKAICTILNLCSVDDVVLIFGSFYLVREVRLEFENFQCF
ncbi:MAG: bifunctional folylpolyglutamate synthase/dihydrofolate synthase [Oscillospiraceae bacterium]|nr:bifunctional folylpolyglutamate synthase/dihydrofolate synthase [Oscillospiraceae bacterium]